MKFLIVITILAIFGSACASLDLSEVKEIEREDIDYAESPAAPSPHCKYNITALKKYDPRLVRSFLAALDTTKKCLRCTWGRRQERALRYQSPRNPDSEMFEKLLRTKREFSASGSSRPISRGRAHEPHPLEKVVWPRHWL